MKRIVFFKKEKNFPPGGMLKWIELLEMNSEINSQILQYKPK